MNFFFGYNDLNFKSEIQIPIFQNRKLKRTKLRLFKIFVFDKKWILEDVTNNKVNDFFFVLKNNDIQNNEIFFLGDENVTSLFDNKRLKNFNNFTDTSPSFRSNFKIYIKNGGFSSYQSEYPYSMVTKRGSVISSISSLANPNADKNFILFRNVFHEPINENFKGYLVNHKTKSILDTFILKTNYTNCFELNKKHIKPEVFFITDKFLGIPMYVSVKNSFISFEHTHPPHEYIQGENKYVKVTNLKKELIEIIN